MLKPFVIGIDGNCGSGKTTLSSLIKEKFDCNVFHMDDYYLPFEKRESNWEMIPGGNIDVERFYSQVLLPAKNGEIVRYQPYFCREERFLSEMFLESKPLVIVEGSYSHLPQLASAYDLKLFLTCSRDEQKRRLISREGERFLFYESRWIPMEERYYRAFFIPEKADIVIETKEMEVYKEILLLLQAYLPKER